MRPTAYRRNARGLRDRQAFEQIRMQAGALFAAGRSQAEVARTLGVARQNVSPLVRTVARRCAGGAAKPRPHWTPVKVSGCLRSLEGAQDFAAIRSYIPTATRAGQNMFDVLIQAAAGTPGIPATT